jgi:hypothetical protein
MAPLIAPDPMTLYPPTGETDEHGWALPGSEPYWTGQGALQLQPGISDPRAADGGGMGPYNPARDKVGAVFLPVEAGLIEGSVLVCRGRTYFVSQSRFVGDPTGNGDGTAPLDCWTAQVTATDQWPDPAHHERGL